MSTKRVLFQHIYLFKKEEKSLLEEDFCLYSPQKLWVIICWQVPNVCAELEA